MYRKNRRCTGRIEKQSQSFMIITNDLCEKEVYACSKCRRLYFENGEPVLSEDGRFAQLVNNIPIFIGGTTPVRPGD